ncbi:hypothetical protein QQX10_03670 [Demequina sp. SYSU T00039]|uniref:DUF3558 domain-containing protein n=1 Tax=Demequina lignilytica TaxID=3051663 RepID=A0AAW7M5K2_9MICO|nr:MULTISPECIES: hypothetical protein [unclassified Demequina]MDN4477088.1 hypothetical protein [Demequina sp. SYSU T00039-1]MDN4487261.1 hypothetical protein [Demequina sp. SYSU T00039]MDN4491512.1 hypothetical protein [Demequina sp. SYSU T00068]
MRTAAVAWAGLPLLLAGCTGGGTSDDASTGPGASGPAPTVVDSAVALEPACDEALESPGGAFEAAAAAAELGRFDAAWICVYPIGDGSPVSSGPAEIEDLDRLGALLDGIGPADTSQGCTLEAGPRYLLVLADGASATRLVIESYGCRFVTIDGYDGLFGGSRDMVAELEDLAGL